MENLERDRIKNIVSFIDGTDLDFVQIENDGKKFLIRRSVHPSVVEIVAENGKVKEPEMVPPTTIRSPIVGRFYSSISADRPALVVEGGAVSAGGKVAIVEAMGIKKEVFSPYTGKIVRIHVRDGDAVEYGQELFTVEEGESFAAE